MTKPLKVLDCFSGIGGFALAESFFEGQLYDFGSCVLCWGNINDE